MGGVSLVGCMYCAFVGRAQVVRLLLAAKCPVEWRARDGRTALLDAVATSIGSGDTLCIRMLVQAKADCTIAPRGGPSPLQVRPLIVSECVASGVEEAGLCIALADS